MVYWSNKINIRYMVDTSETRFSLSRGSDAFKEMQMLNNEQIFTFFNGEKINRIAQNVYELALGAESEQVRLAASKEILDRTIGKPKHAIEVTQERPSIDLKRLSKEELQRLRDAVVGKIDDVIDAEEV